LVGLVSAAVPLYGQCGGIGYTGETTCVAGAVCVYSNDYYSQCLAGTVTTTVTTKSTTTSRTTASAATTTSKTTTSTASAPSGSIPAGAITVGSGGKYSTIAAALKDTSSNVYYIYAGTYKEQILISRANVKIYGQTPSALDYTANTVTITNNIPASQAGSNDASGTVRVSATGVRHVFLVFKTIWSDNLMSLDMRQLVQSQLTSSKPDLREHNFTVALTSMELRTLYVCTDTPELFVEVGMEASIWITKSTIETIASGYITASGRSTADANYYVIDNSTIKGMGSCYLGRPWREYARVVVQNTNIGSNVVAAGWKVWSTDDPRTGHVYYGEYANTG
ncbi:hypothetical protein FRC09_016657, partial [Ceratobasidium sp. 395]